ncbi:hypothetical protein B0J17DRAFT_56767 [Rhizoctonia solani]|nr:hypothetical protein B0J17DRAFT_56767 [Rhizoctonia solani]
MANHSGWYPSCQVCLPPELPTYLKNVYDLKPVVGIPEDEEVIGIHAVLQAARKASETRYRSKYSLITFPSDATYAPPVLPVHMAVNLDPICGAPSDEEIMKVHDAAQTYQEFRRFPAMFDARVHMELSQHLFDIQMARYMRLASESPPNPGPETVARSQISTRSMEREITTAEEAVVPTNNAGSGANTAPVQESSPTHGTDIRDLMERSNQLAERFNQLLEHSNEITERHSHTADKSDSQALGERFNQVLERLAQLVERSQQPAERSERLVERFNELFERSNHLMQQLDPPAQRANQLAEQANIFRERLGDVMGNINRVLVRIQHAIVRNHKGNTVSALDCLVNEKGETATVSDKTSYASFGWLLKNEGDWMLERRIPIRRLARRLFMFLRYWR